MSLQARITALAQAVAADIKAQSTALAGKEPSITAGASTEFWRGDKTWQNFGNATRAQLLTGLATPTNVAIAAADTVLAAFAKLQGQVTARMTNPMTAAGDMIRGGTSGAPERVAAGTNGYVWTMTAGVPGWAAAAAGGGVGISQTWQNMTASRALATTYTNSTGVPIAVEVTLMSTTSGQLSITPTVDGVSLGQTIYPAGASGFAFSRAFIVPPGSTYSIGTASSSATPSLSRWVELRA